MYKIDIKPISINQPYSADYKEQLFEYFSNLDLPKVDPQQPLFLFLEFGIKNKMDLSNGIKRFEDCLVSYLKINDRKISGIYLKKIIVKKGGEYIRFNIFGHEYDLITYLKSEI